MKNIEELEEEQKLEYCEQCGEDLPIEHICLTCCGDEMHGSIEDTQICPTCKEHQ